MHVTAVLMKAIDQGKKYDDPEIKDVCAQARHGQFYREKTYNMVKADLDTANAKKVVGQHHGLADTIAVGGVSDEIVDEAIAITTGSVEFLEIFGDQPVGCSRLSRKQTDTAVLPSLQSLFGPGGLTGFMQQLAVTLRGVMGGPSPMHGRDKC